MTAKGLSEGHPAAYGFLALGLAVLLIMVVFQSAFKSKSSQRKGARAALPAFDVEGNSVANGALHPSISQAAATSDVATIKQWLEDERCNVNAALASDGSTALHSAARHGHANVLRVLLDGGADALSVDLELRTALHLVAAAGHGLCVKGAPRSVQLSLPLSRARVRALCV